MEWLNYHHLHYFWMVAREGSVAAAAEQLRVSQPTISGQVKSLEAALDEKLLRRAGRGLELTEVGQLVYHYADDIFGLGRELLNTVRGRPTGRPAKLQVGIADVVPKLISHRLLAPALDLEPRVQLVCREDKTERLLADLSIKTFDLVLSDEPVGGQARVRAFNHLLGECGVTFFGTPDLEARFKDGFPRSLDDAPLLVPTENTLMRRNLEHWFSDIDIQPRIIAEFEDSALLKEFGRHGAGLFAGATAIEPEIEKEYAVRAVGRTPKVRERFYAITIERRIKNPIVAAIREAAQDRLFKDSRPYASEPLE